MQKRPAVQPCREMLALHTILVAEDEEDIRAVIVAVAPFTLIDPDGFYDALLKPSLVALWLSQLIVFAVYPRFAARRGSRMLPVWLLTAASVAFCCYGLWAVIQHSTS